MSEVDEEPPLDYSETDMVEEETAVTTTTTTTTKEKEDTSRDELLPVLNDDPRGKANAERQRVGQKSGGRNTESFDPKSTLVRPEMRILVGPNQEKYGKPLKHDDVVIVPDFFCKEDDWSLYYKLIEEMRSVQAEGSKQSEWISWHEGAHLITKNPMDCPSFKAIQDKISAYFNIAQKSVGTRFNWYRDSSDWKPFHHDSAAFNPQRAKNQNITVGVSFGASRELAFIHADNKSRIYFPQTNGMMFSFGRDVNIKWKHGVNALHVDEQDGKGRVSIILWGLCPDVIEEKNSPRMISNDRNFGGKGGKGGGGRGGGGKGGRPDDRRGFDRDRSRDRNRDFRDRSRDNRDNRDRSRDMGRGRGDDRDFDRGRNGDRSRGQSRDRDGRDRDGRVFERDDRDDRNRGDYRRERADSRGGPREGGGRDSNYRGNNDNYRGNGGDNYNRPRDGDNRPRENERNDKRPRQSDEGFDARSSDRKNDGDKVTGDNSRDNNRNKKPKVLDKDKPCFSFQKGDCKYGDTCKYSH